MNNEVKTNETIYGEQPYTEKGKILRSEGVYNNAIRQFTLEQFVGSFPNVIDDDVCSGFAKWFDEVSAQHLTMSTIEDSTTLTGVYRKDESIHIPAGLNENCFPVGLTSVLWKNVSECYNIYQNVYDIDQRVVSYEFRAVKVQPAGGYHVWHHEHSHHDAERILAWHLNLEVPKKGGETEFLHQSMRVNPEVGKLLIWPAGFTHKHRGNPPLEGHKTYLSGWFKLLDSRTGVYE